MTLLSQAGAKKTLLWIAEAPRDRVRVGCVVLEAQVAWGKGEKRKRKKNCPSLTYLRSHGLVYRAPPIESVSV